MKKKLQRAATLLLLAVFLCSWQWACAAREVQLEQRCTLRVGTSGDYAPFSSTAIDSGQPSYSGLDILIANGLAQHLGCDLLLVPMRWPSLLEQLARGDFDIALSGVTMRPERSLHGVFSRPYARTGVVVITSGLHSVADLNRPGTTLAVNRGGHLERWARQHLPEAALQPVDRNESLPSLLRKPEIDGIVTDTAEAIAWSRLGNTLGPFSTDYKAVLMGAHALDRAAAIDAWLSKGEADGSLGALRAAHLADRQVSSANAATMQAVAAIIRLRLELMPMVAAAKRTMVKAVTDGAQERRVIERAAVWAPAARSRIDTVFPVLIDLAKMVQRRSPSTDLAPPLAELRTAIENIDRQLVREIERLPAADTSAWAGRLRALAENLPLGPAEIQRLAEALAKAGAIPHRPLQ